MTIGEAVETVNRLNVNQYTKSDKIMWLSRLDFIIFEEVLKTHNDNNLAEFKGYTDKTDDDTALLVKVPFDEIYINFLDAEIYKHNGEINKYNNSITLFNNALNSFKAYYNRQHMPIQNVNGFKY